MGRACRYSLSILSVELVLFLGEELVSVVGDVEVECRCSRYSRGRLFDADDSLVSVCQTEMADGLVVVGVVVWWSIFRSRVGRGWSWWLVCT